MRDHSRGDAGVLGERADGERAAHADAQLAGQHLVDEEELPRRQSVPEAPQCLGAFFRARGGVDAAEREHALLDPRVERHVVLGRQLAPEHVRGVDEERDRLGEVADRGVALLEQPRREAGLVEDELSEVLPADDALQSLAGQEEHRPRRVRVGRTGEVAPNRGDLRVGGRRGVQDVVEIREEAHGYTVTHRVEFIEPHLGAALPRQSSVESLSLCESSLGARWLAFERGLDRFGLDAAFAEQARERRGVAVCHTNARGAGLLDGREERGVVGVVADDEAVVDDAPAPRPTQSHPTGREGGRRVAEALRPRRASSRWRCDDERARERSFLRLGRREVDRRERDAAVAIELGDGVDGSVCVDGPRRTVLEHREKPLRLAESVREEKRRAAGVRGRVPRRDEPIELDLRRGPAIHGKRERRFGDEAIAAHDLERCAGGIGLSLEVARHDPDLAAGLDPNLRGAAHVAGGMERHARRAELERLAVGVPDDRRVVTEPASRERDRLVRAVVLGASGPRVIGVRVREDGALDGLPRVDVKRAALAREAATIGDDEIGHEA